MEYIKNIEGISINIPDIDKQMSRNKEHIGAAVGGRPIGSVFFVSAH